MTLETCNTRAAEPTDDEIGNEMRKDTIYTTVVENIFCILYLIKPRGFPLRDQISPKGCPVNSSPRYLSHTHSTRRSGIRGSAFHPFRASAPHA